MMRRLEEYSRKKKKTYITCNFKKLHIGLDSSKLPTILPPQGFALAESSRKVDNPR